MTESSETPVGQSPASGGHVKKYASAAERAKAFRQRQKELVAIAKGTSAPDVADGVVDQPEAAITSLAYAVGELRRLAELQTHFGTRIEQAVALIADPARLDATLETAKTQALHQVAEAQAAAADARVAAQNARAERAEITRERDSALEEAAAALDRVTEVEAIAQWLIAEARHGASVDVAAAERAQDAAEEARRCADEARVAGERAAEEAIGRTRDECAATVDAAQVEAREQVRAAEALAHRAATEAQSAQDRAAATENELAAVRAELAEVRADARSEARALRDEISRERVTAREDQQLRDAAHTAELEQMRHDADERVSTLRASLDASQAALDALTRRPPPRTKP